MEPEAKAAMGRRLKEEIKQKYGTITKLNKIINEQNLGGYTSKKPREPRAGLLIKLGRAGCDLNYILLNERSASYPITKSKQRFSGNENAGGDIQNIGDKADGNIMKSKNGNVSVHNGDLYSNEIVATLREVIYSQQQMLAQNSKSLEDISIVLKSMNIMVNQHHTEDHEYINDARKMWADLTLSIEQNRKQTAALKKHEKASEKQKSLWMNHIVTAEKGQKEMLKILKDEK